MVDQKRNVRVFLIFSSLYFLVFLSLAKVQVFGDGFHYFIFFPALIDGLSLDLSNAYSRYSSYSPLAFFYSMEDSGYAKNLYPFGSSLLQFPFFLGAFGYDHLFGCFAKYGFHDFLTTPYLIAQVVSTWFYGWLGFYFLWRMLSRVAGEKGRFPTLVCIFAATPLWNYLIHDPSYSHVYSFFAMALTYSLWYGPFEKDSVRRGLLFGTCLGLVFLIRWQDIFFLAPIACELIVRVVHKRRSQAEYLRRRERLGFSIGASLGFLIWALPQLIYWKIVYGKFLLIPQGQEAFTPSDTHFTASLFSWERGLFSWHPILLVGAIGLGLLAWKRKRYRWLLLGIALQWGVTGAIRDWHGSYAFGQRRWVSALPFWGLGLAYLFQTRSFMMKAALYALAVVAVVWNFFLHCAWSNGFMSGGALSPRSLFRILFDGGWAILYADSFKLAFFLGRLRSLLQGGNGWALSGACFFILLLGLSFWLLFRTLETVARKRQAYSGTLAAVCLAPPILLTLVFVSLDSVSIPAYRMDFLEKRPSESLPLPLTTHRVYPGKTALAEIDSYSVQSANSLAIPVANPQRVSGMTLVSYIEGGTGDLTLGAEAVRITLAGDSGSRSFSLRMGEDIDYAEIRAGRLQEKGGKLQCVWGTLSEEGQPHYWFKKDFRFESLEVRSVLVEVPTGGYEVAIASISFSPPD